MDFFSFFSIENCEFKDSNDMIPEDFGPKALVCQKVNSIGFTRVLNFLFCSFFFDGVDFHFARGRKMLKKLKNSIFHIFENIIFNYTYRRGMLSQNGLIRKFPSLST